MATQQKANNSAASGDRSSGAAARSERNGKAKAKPKIYTWRGIKLELPGEPPGSLLWDFREFERAQQEEEDRVSPLLDLLESLIGREQEYKIRKKVIADQIPLGEMAGELQTILEGILKKYGLGVGESKASSRS